MNVGIVKIGAPGAASPGFEQPFEMLHACHERVLRMLDLLWRLRDHAARNGSDDQARQAARDVMRYFDQAAPQHHRDEEVHVFPRLLAQGDPVNAALVARLQLDHLDMETRWAAAREILAMFERGDLRRLDGPAHAGTLDAFAKLYASHIRAEEQIAYPAAEASMDPEAIEVMGREMMRRRGLH
jgi:hemerythrin-like domain-containing protein